MAAAAEVPALESESNELTRKLAGFRARLDADKRFQNEIKNCASAPFFRKNA